MSVISYIRQFGLRSAAAKAQATIAARLFSRALMREDRAADPATISGMTRVNTSSMSADYKAYVDEQISRSVKRSTYTNPLRKMMGSRDRLIQQVARVSSAWSIPPAAALSIGCRDERELDTIARLLKAKHVTGVDLFSASPRIVPADMHNLPFESGTFDVTVAIHCMEHSYDARQSLGQMVRVTRPGGLIAVEVPVGFEVTEFDRNDFKGVLELAALFPEQSVSLLWAEVENRAELSKSPTVRLILQKRNAART
jgi:SAM-dependent methyltransferase